VDLRIPSYSFHVDSAEALQLADSHGCSSYVAEFVVLAQQLACPLLTFDRKLLQLLPQVAVKPGSYVRLRTTCSSSGQGRPTYAGPTQQRLGRVPGQPRQGKVPDVLIRCPPKSNIADVTAAWKLVAEKRWQPRAPNQAIVSSLSPFSRSAA
jgi:hypothetical protein